MAFDIPRGHIFRVDRVDVRLATTPHPFEDANRGPIESNWMRERLAKPAIFNGSVVLLSSLSWREGLLEGVCHPISYAGFLYWRRQQPRESAEHAFAHAMLVTTDGALIAIRMAGSTINAGKVYFAAGSFEAQDFPLGRVDVSFNMAREVREETGIDISGIPRDAGFHAFSHEGGTVIFQRYFLPWTALDTTARITAFIAGERDPEIDGPIVLTQGGAAPDGLVPYMRVLVDWHFDNPRTAKLSGTNRV